MWLWGSPQAPSHPMLQPLSGTCLELLRRGVLSLWIFIYLEKYYIFEVPKEEAQMVSVLGLLHF